MSMIDRIASLFKVQANYIREESENVGFVLTVDFHIFKVLLAFVIWTVFNNYSF